MRCCVCGKEHETHDTWDSGPICAGGCPQPLQDLEKIARQLIVNESAETGGLGANEAMTVLTDLFALMALVIQEMAPQHRDVGQSCEDLARKLQAALHTDVTDDRSDSST